jgi:hypothetical protein
MDSSFLKLRQNTGAIGFVGSALTSVCKSYGIACTPLRRNRKHGTRSVGAVLEQLVSGDHAHTDISNPGAGRQLPTKAARVGAKIGRDQMKGLASVG